MRKTYFKKSLSVIMAVLMVMSCWVFVAPTKAEASEVNYGTPDINQVTGYVTIDPVVYVHGSASVDTYSYMMYGYGENTIADGTYAGEFHTNVSITGKTLQSITVEETGANPTVGVKSVWQTSTNTFAEESVLSGTLGGGFGWIGSSGGSTGDPATLKFQFTDGTYEYHTVYVETNPVAQHALSYTYCWNGYGSYYNGSAFLVAAVGSYGQNAKGSYTYQRNGKLYSGVFNWPDIYSPCNEAFTVGNDAEVKGYFSGTTVDKYAGYFGSSGNKGNSKGRDSNYNRVVSATANYYLDLSSNVNSGIIHTAGTNNWSIKMFVGNIYDTKSGTNPTLTSGYPSAEHTLSSEGLPQTLTNKTNVTGFSVISGTATAGQTITGNYVVDYSFNVEPTVASRVTMPYSITVVDKSALRNVYNQYIGEKLQAKHYTSTSWNNYSKALLQAEYYLNNYEADTANEATLKANLETAYNNLKLVQVTYENLFYLNSYANSTSAALDTSKGSITVDLVNNNISIQNNQSTELTTATSGFTGGANRDVSKYAIRVQPNTEYYLDCTRDDSLATSNVYLFYYDASGVATWDTTDGNFAESAELGTNDFISRVDTKSGKNHLKFKTTDKAAFVELRFDADSQGTFNYKDVAIYPASREDEVKISTWTTRPVSKYNNDSGLSESDMTAEATRTGYTFNAWYWDENGNGIIDSGENKGISSWKDLNTVNFDHFNLLSKWTPNQYTIAFNANGGSGSMSNIAMTYDVAKNLTANSFTRTGYTFAGWNTQADGKGTTYANSQEVKNLTATNGATVTLYAQWTINQYTVTFEFATGTKTTQIYDYNATIKAPDNTANNYDENNHYSYSWPEFSKVTGDVTYTEIQTSEAHSYTYTYKDATNHTATCSCGYSKDVAHTEGTAATCTTQAVCKDCKESYGTAKGHDFSGTIKNDGNTKNGTHSYLCKNGCGTYGNATAHSWNEGVVNPDSTCTAEGTKTYTCTVGDCGATYTEVVSAKGHTPKAAVKENEKVATCTEGGSYDEVVYCSVCNAEISRTPKTTEKLGHTFGAATSKKDATCTAAGNEAYKQCETCKLYFAEAEKTDSTNGKADESSFVINALGHDMTKTDAKAATCTADGNKEYYTCSRCVKLFEDKDAKTETTLEKVTIKAAHSWNADFTIDEAATCEEAGSKSIHCSKCDEKKTVTTIDALGHKFTNETVDEKYLASNATCTEKAKYYKSCSVCDASSKDKDGEATFENGEALGHDFTVEVEGTKTAATCKETGSVTMKCSRCDATTVKTLEIDPNNHQGETEIRDKKIANCHEKGYTGDKYCLDCQAKIETGTETEIDKNNHVGETQVRDTVAATCSKAGYTGDTYCLGCNDKIETGHATAIDPSNHESTETYVKDAKVATCTSEGYTGDTHHKCCDALKSKGETIPMLSHTYVNKVDEKYLASEKNCTAKAEYYTSCSVCGASSKGTVNEGKFQTGDVLGHDFTVEVEGTKTAATCKETGSVTMKCSRCDETKVKTLEIDPNNHQGETEIRDKKIANCHEKGYTGDKYCLDCEIKIETGTETEIDKNNHVGETQVRDTVTATCSKAGYTGDTYCLGCNDKIETGHATAIDPNNHVAKEEKAKQEPTCTEVGYTAGVYCGDCKTWLSGHEEIPALGHDYKYTVNEPTCTVDGVSITTCKRENCDYYKSTTLTAPGHDEVKTSVAATCQEYAHTLVTCNNCDYSRKDYTGTTFAPHKWVTINEAVEATCTNEGRTAYEKCAVCKAEIVSVTIPKLPHVDEDKDGVCDNCDGKFFNSNDACGCICHKDSFIMRIIYAIARFFWKLFKIDKSCACGAVHY